MRGGTCQTSGLMVLWAHLLLNLLPLLLTDSPLHFSVKWGSCDMVRVPTQQNKPQENFSSDRTIESCSLLLESAERRQRCGCSGMPRITAHRVLSSCPAGFQLQLQPQLQPLLLSAFNSSSKLCLTATMRSHSAAMLLAGFQFAS